MLVELAVDSARPLAVRDDGGGRYQRFAEASHGRGSGSELDTLVRRAAAPMRRGLRVIEPVHPAAVLPDGRSVRLCGMKLACLSP
jgi:hypothetical protein